MKRWFVLICCLVFILTSCVDSGVPVGPQKTEAEVEEQIEESVEDKLATVEEAENEVVVEPAVEVVEVIEPVQEIDPVQEIVDSMTLEEKVAQLFYISLTTYKQLEGPPVGGVIYFSEDMTSASEIREEISQLQKASSIPMFIGIDEEGGIVTRITGDSGIGGTVVPTPWKLSQVGDYEDVYQVNSIIGRELNALGFNMNFAPVADIRTNIYNPIIGKRAYNEDATKVADYVSTAMKAYRDTWIIPVVKHFPGHGDTVGDSHIESVMVEHDMERLMSVELLPFIAAIQAQSEMIMVGHIKVPEVTEEDLPASLSKELIQGLLVESLGYDGLIISDALNMKGITKHHSVEEVIELGFEAGMDVFLMPDDYEGAYEYLLQSAMDRESYIAKIDASVYKIIELKMAKGIVDSSRMRFDLTEVGSEENKQQIQSIMSQ